MAKSVFKKRKRGVKINTNVLIVTPTKLEFPVDIFTSQFCMMAFKRGIAGWETMPARAAEDARNKIMRKTIKERPEFTHFFFLDADSFPYDAFMIEKLLMHDKAVIAGPTPTQRVPKAVYDYKTGLIKPGNIRRMWNVVLEEPTWNPATKTYDNLKCISRNHQNPALDELPDKLFKAAHVGCTGLLVRRDVIEALEEPYQYTHRNEVGDVCLSEDYDFCKKITAAGFDIWIDPTLKCGHRQTLDIGNY